MGKEFLKKTSDLLQEKHKRKQWQKVVISLSLVVAMITTGLLIHPALTMERKTICGQEEHTHSKDCYIKKLVCGKEETTAGEGAEGEAVEEHKHTDACYEEVLVCNKEEHKHTDSCYEQKTEAKEETTQAAASEETKKEEAVDTPKEEEKKDADSKDDKKEEKASEEETKEAAARTLTYKGDDYNITVDCPKEAEIPEEAELKVREIKKEKDKDEYNSYYDKAEEALKKSDDTDISFVRFFDISFMVGDEEIEPKAKVEVKITYDKKVEVSDKGEVKSVHFGDDKTEVLDVKTNEADGKMDEIKFDAKSFSVYAVVGTETLTGDVLTADGKTYTVTVTYGADAKIPEGATLQVEEVDQNSDEYINYSDQALKAITDDKDVEIASARFFDVSIIVNGKEYEPQAPVTIKITYNDPFNVEIGDEIKQVHFAENGTEVLDVDVNKDDNGQITDVIFDQGSFSVTGTVVTSLKTGWPSETGYYAVIVKASNGKYYAIKKNGVLTEVKYDATNDKVSFIDITNTEDLVDYQWTYNNRYLLNDDMYIDPQNKNGVSRNKRQLKRTKDGYIYYSYSKYSQKYYLSADVDKFTLKPGDESQAVEVFFANQFSADGNAGGGTEGGEEEVDLGAPTTDKTLSNNKDGTYNLSLSVTGKSQAQSSRTKVDVVIVFDRSGSMTMSKSSNDYMDYESGRRDYEAIQAVKSLIDTLWINNTDEFPDTVHISLVDFANSAEIKLNGSTEETQSKETVKNIVNTLKGNYGQGTNWEAGLQKANSIGTRDGATKYVIFVSDGNPTYANNYGNGQEEATNMRECYDRAKDDARAIVKSGASFYTIGVFGNPDRMSNLTAFAYSGNDIGTYPQGHYQTANDQTSLNNAFQSIINDIQKNFTYTDVTITDGITDLTATTLVNGKSDNFNYKVTDKDGNDITSSITDLPEAYFENGRVTWSLGENYKLISGAKYTVSFKVWPSQEAYDTLANLENGLITWNDVDKTQFTRKLNEDGSYTYSLNTNTDASVSYRQITTTNGIDGTPSESKTSEITNPPGMVLADTVIDIEKIWDDGGYTTDKPTSVIFYVMCDNVKYTEIELTSENDWKESIYIAPGLQVKGEILESGHTYTIVEKDTSNSYIFTADTIHPMLIDSATNISYGEGKSAVLTGTNTYQPSSFVVRIFKTDIGTTSPLEGAEFKLCSDLDGKNIAKDADGNNVSIQYQTGGIYLIGKLSEGTYYLFETKAPDGYYLLEEPITITVSQTDVTYDQPGNSNSQGGGVVTSEDGATFTINVTNTSGQKLPNTGGSGTLPYTLGGLMIMTAAALMYGFIMRRRERRLY